MSTIVDARGLSCPQPFLMTMDEIKKVSKGEIEVLVNTDTSKENVSRAAETLQVVPVNSPLLRPVDIFQTKDYGRYFMVRAANMKLTIDNDTLTVVNISGGGCPDVPYLEQEMVGKTLADAPQPKEIDHTLCGYALQLAYEEMRRQC